MHLHRRQLIIAIPLLVSAGFVLALFLSLGYLSTPAQAAGNVLYVSDGSSECGTTSPPSWCSGRYSDIQSAVDDATPDDEIRVENLTYSGVVSRSAPAGYVGATFVTQTVFITKNLTIRGGYTEYDFTSGSSPSSRTTVAPAIAGRGFFVAGADVTLENIILTGGTAADLGGSDAPADAGGAIYVLNGSTTINNGEIHNNVAARGAGIYAVAGIVTLSASTVRDNTASDAGGGLYANDSILSMSTTTFEDNQTTSGAGGGVYLDGGTATLTTPSLLSNDADTNGAGLYATSAAVTVTLGTIRSNSANTGAGIYADGGRLTLSGVTIEQNNAGSNGGGLYLNDSQTTITANSWLTGNQAGAGGGGLYASGASSTMTQVQVRGNQASAGAGIFADTGTVTIASTTFDDNVATSNGGGLYLSGAQVALDDNTNVTSNEANGDGGGLYATAGTTLTSDSTALALNLNTANSGGGAFITGSSANFDTLTLGGNTSTRIGGGAVVTDSGALTVTNGTVTTNEAPVGGGLYAGGAGTLVMTDTTVSNHANSDTGAGIYAHNASIAFETVTIQDNTATSSGAGLYLDTGSALTATTLDMQRNGAGSAGGALYARNSRLDIAGNSEVSHNTVTSGMGGGLYLDTVTGTVASTLMEHNSAQRGGGIYAIGGDVTISDTTVHTNTAKIDGGGLYVAAARSRIERSRITQNLSDRGGGLFLGGKRATLSENTVAENTTTLRRTTLFNKPIGIGAGVYISGTTVAMSDNQILTNTIPYRSKTEVVGQVTETIVITQTGPDPADWIIIEKGPITETRTSADSGAGVYMLKGTGVFTGNVFRGNESSLHGGAMFLGGSDVRLVNNLLIRNSIGVSNALGSAIYVSSTKISLVHNTIADNVHRDLDGDGTNSALQLAGGNMLSMTNNIIAYHDIGVNASEGNSGDGTANVWWANSERNWTRDLFGQTTVHIFGDPGFVGSNDYHIAADSAAVDTGVDAGIFSDIAGTSRPRGFAPDAGAYEHQYTHGVYLDQSATPLAVGQGETLTHVITVVNHSTQAVNNLQVNVTLPAEQQLLNSSIDRGTCSGLTCNVPSLAQNESAHVTLDLDVTGTPKAGTVVPMTTTVDVTFDGMNPADTDTSDAFATYLQEVFDPADPPGGGDGSVYTGACRISLNGTDYESMQAAIAQASRPSDVVKVSGYCADTILLNNPTLPEVTIQGGWSTDLTAHDPDIYTATLDALGRAPVVSIIGESLAPVVEDLLLVNGNNVVGGGVYVQEAGATLRNLHIANSTASNYGGGIYIDSGVSTIEESRLEGNSAGIGGGGIYLLESGTQVKHTDFVNNSGATDGGAAYLKKSGATIADGLIDGHTVSGLGGGIYLDESPASIQRNEIRSNSASAGGGIFADSSPATLSRNEIRDNEATSSPDFVLIVHQSPGGGGGIYGEKSDLRILNNTILGNTAPSDAGAGIHMWDARQPQIDGNVIADNNGGHGVYLRLTPAVFKVWILIPPIKPPPFGEELILPIEQPPPVRMRHNTISRNSGDGLHVYGQTTVEMENNIIWENSGTGVAIEEEVFPHIIGVVIAVPPGIPVPLPVPVPTFYPPKVTMARTLWGIGGPSTDSAGAFSSLSHSEDFGGSSCQNWIFGSGTEYCDPAFQDPDNGDYHIKRTSPAFQLARSLDVSKDVDGEDRIQGNLPDLGADEYTFRRVRYATPNSTHDGAGDRCLNYANPCTLQAAIDKAVDGDLVKVAGKAPSTGNASYTTVFARNGQSQVAYVDKSITIQGGYCPAFTPQSGPMDCDWETPDPDTYPSIIDPSGTGRGIYVAGDVSPEIIGLRVINGDAGAAGMDGRGGGIYVISATATISDMEAFTNTAVTGAGVYLDASKTTVQNSLLRGNGATQGGGIALHSGEASAQGNTITTNTADDGAGIFVDGSKGTVISNTVTSNTATNGAGVYVVSGEAEVTQNGISGNNATAGGGIYVASSDAQILTNEISNNSGSSGGGIYMDATAARVAGNTVGSNNATSGGGFFLDAVLDGIVEGNMVENNTASGDGGGLYLRSSTGLITKNTVAGNSGSNGGGLYLESFSGATLEKNTIATNDAGTYGGGVYMKLSDATLNENTVMTNTAGSGAGIYSKLSANSIVSNTVRANTASLFAGGLYLDESNTSVTNSTIEDNSALSAGGAYLLRSSNAKIEDSTIAGNSATNNGGGVYLQLSDSTLSRLRFTGNNAGANGGALYLSTSVATLEQIIARNNSAQQGGAVYLYNGSDAAMSNHVIAETRADNAVYVTGSDPTLKHTTFARNSDTGLYAAGDSTVSLINTIMVSHTLGLYVESSSAATLNATLWHDNQLDWNGAGTIELGDTNLNGDPNFEPDGYHLGETSPALNEGVDAGVAVDVDGDHRPQGGAPDLGADELPTDCFVKVSSDMSTTYTVVQDAIDAANAGDEVKVAGKCLGVRTRSGLQQAAYVDTSITVAGGYTPTNWVTSYPMTQTTIINAQNQGRVLYVTGSATPVIRGLTLTGGSASGLGGGPNGLDAGGAVYVGSTSATISQTKVTNSSAYYGGGIYLQSSETQLITTTVSENSGTKGGGVFLRSSDAAIERSEVSGNSASGEGGGLFISFGTPALTDTVIAGNTAASGGGGLFIASSDAVIGDGTIAGNSANAGGGAYLDNSTATLTHNTIEENQAENAGGVYLANSGATLSANTLTANSANNNGGAVYAETSDAEIVNNVIAGNQAGTTGSAGYVLSASPRLVHNTLVDNSGGDGTALSVAHAGAITSDATVTNNIFSGHSTAIAVSAGDSATVTGALWHDNNTTLAGAGTIVTDTTNFAATPDFVAPAAGDYRLQRTSSAIDAGVNSGVLIDLEGDPRPTDLGYDIGADEYYNPELVVLNSATPKPAVANTQLTYNFRVANVGNVPLTATVTATLPFNATPTGVMTWTQVALPIDATWERSIVVTVNPDYDGTLVSELTASAVQGAAGSATETVDVVPSDAGLDAVQSTQPTIAERGESLRYNIRVVNTGNISLNATITATLPAQVTPNDPVVWKEAIPSGSNVLHPVDVQVPADAVDDLISTVDVTTQEGLTTTNTITTPLAASALALSVAGRPAPVEMGAPLTYTLIVTNTGNVATDVFITDTLPVQVTPAGAQHWSTALSPDASWSEEVVMTAPSWYLGPLTNVLRATTADGAVGVVTDTTETALNSLVPTIRSTGSGAWSDPATWDENRVPDATDIVLVQTGHDVTLPTSIAVTSLINRGTLTSIAGCQTTTLAVSDQLRNFGQILGTDGGPEEAGCSFMLQLTTLINEGDIIAGNGGDVVETGPGAAGAGGEVFVIAGANGPGQVANTGLIRGGDAGHPNPDATAPQDGAPGGDVIISAAPMLSLAGGRIIAGQGSDGVAGGTDGERGEIIINGGDDATIDLEGAQISGGDVSVSAGDGADIQLGGTIDAEGDATVAVGAGGTVGGDAGSDVNVETDRILYNVRLVGPAQVRTAPADDVLVSLTLLNLSPKDATYEMAFANTAGWTARDLPATVTASGAGLVELTPALVAPADAQVGRVDTLTITATRSGGTATDTRTIEGVIGPPHVYLPLLVR